MCSCRSPGAICAMMTKTRPPPASLPARDADPGRALKRTAAGHGRNNDTANFATRMVMFKSSPLFQLYLVRLRDFYRQPARIFWVYGFPTLMAIALGLAFQNRLPGPVPIDLVKSEGADWIKGAAEAHNAVLASEARSGKPRL